MIKVVTYNAANMIKAFEEDDDDCDSDDDDELNINNFGIEEEVGEFEDFEGRNE